MKALTATASVARHLLGAMVEATLVIAIVAALAVGVALASGQPAGAEPVAAVQGSVSVPDGVFGGTTVATANPSPLVYAACYQSGLRVYAQYARTDAGGRAVLTLGPTVRWTGGSANCVAEEGYFARNGHWHRVAGSTFNVAG